MMDDRFSWDEGKNKTNLRKHGVSFNEAKTVFDDDYAKIYFDEEHSDYEERFVVIGQSSNRRLLMVCHCYRDDDFIIRIISARKANNREVNIYGGVR